MNTTAMTGFDLSADFARYLPVRWKFHCFVSGEPHGEWNIHRWRHYLLEPNYPIDVAGLLGDKHFLGNVQRGLNAFGVHSLEDLPRFWDECVREYTAELLFAQPESK